MKVGFYHSCFEHWDLEQTFKWAKENGFYGIELHGGPRYKHGNWQEWSEGKNVSQLLSLTEKYEMPVTGIMFGALPFLSPDPDKRKEAVRYIEMLLKAAANLDIKVVSTFTGRDPMKTIEENLDLYAEVFPQVAEIAEKQGVT